MEQITLSRFLDWVIWRLENETDPEQIAQLRIVKDALESMIGR